MAVDLPTVVVEGAAVVASHAMRDGERRALAAFTDAMGLHPVDPPVNAAVATAVDPAREARLLFIEDTLKKARGPLDLGDRDAVSALRTSVAAAYAEARAHPEDPEAPFLVGEALRTLARIEDLAGEPSGARALRRRAELLDGGRMIGLSEGGPLSPSPAATITVTFRWTDGAATAFIDGAQRDVSKPVTLHPGEHHIRTASGTTTLHAAWVTIVEAGELPLRGSPPRVPCSLDDLSPALSASSFEIGCARWLRVTRRSGALEVRICGPTSCGAPSTWSTIPLAPPPPWRETSSAWSSRWTWVGIGAAALISGTITAWSLGAFDRREPPPPTWRWEGAR